MIDNENYMTVSQYKPSRTLLYNGNFDIICNHNGITDMIQDLHWSGLDAYR